VSLRRTALARKTELKRGQPIRRGQIARASRVTKTIDAKRRPKDTGPSTALRRLVAERAGFCCEGCGLALHNGDRWVRVHSFHHRLPRGRQGRNTASNLLLLCGSGTTDCHGIAEDQRTAAYGRGFLVRTGQTPAAVPVQLWTGIRVLLTDDGTYDLGAPQ
jgi:hypothetical protein